MQTNDSALNLLDLITEPAFCVRSQKITKVNAAAASLLLEPDMDIAPLLHTGVKEYEAFTDGCLYLTMHIHGQLYSARILKMPEYDVFQLETCMGNPRLQAMALAARDLRTPLSGMLICTDRLFSGLAHSDDPTTEQLISQINRNLFQLMRTIGNMSDAGESYSDSPEGLEYRDIGSIVDEILKKAQPLAQKSGLTLTYTGLASPVSTMVDAQQLERAILNLLSNAMKFTAPGGHIAATLNCKDNKLYFSISDDGTGIPSLLEGRVFSSFHRSPQIEDSRFGIGLGMVLVCSAASRHGGTVLVDHPKGIGTRVTISMAVRVPAGDRLQSPKLRVDYTGELDHTLVELSDVLPPELYTAEEIN